MLYNNTINMTYMINNNINIINIINNKFIINKYKY